MEACRIVVLVSGNGSNLQAIIDHLEKGKTEGEIVAVFANRPSAYGLTRASDAGIPAHCIDHKAYASREEYDAALMQHIDSYSPDLIVLAGFMRILTEPFVQHYHGRMLNIHPSLLPKYKGLDTHQRALDAGELEHGASVHFVTAELDGGPVIIQSKVPIYEDDDASTLQQRVQYQERDIYPLVVQWFCNGRLRLNDNVVFLDGKALPAQGYAAD
ncbi:phosphoribosylglycinamide formyltransferase [Aestuariibacter salexigens]|uniref:phosphoribosylglycinamide formyltransferase n=1 Tax=Aestuariibacter salexigens TaxID=226010 RepID=UPI00040ACA61|nr:phosphoribosylglycinamide formyltransferase [Aestuariibacter salexigens]